MLAGFGGFEVGPVVEGVVVYQDRQIIFENREATRFGVADDGSSFCVMEPMAGNVTRLVIRNLDLGVEVHHDLGALQPDPDTNAYAGYSVDQKEVIVGIPDAPPVPRTHFGGRTMVSRLMSGTGLW